MQFTAMTRAKEGKEKAFHFLYRYARPLPLIRLVPWGHGWIWVRTVSHLLDEGQGKVKSQAAKGKGRTYHQRGGAASS